MTERALSWLDEEQAKQRITRMSEIPEEERPNFDEILYGTGQNNHGMVTESITKALNLKQRGQHVRR